LSLNHERKSLIQFLTKCSSRIAFCGDSDNNILSNIINIKFLRIINYNMLMSKIYIEIIIPKLSIACFAFIAIIHPETQNILKTFYHS